MFYPFSSESKNHIIESIKYWREKFSVMWLSRDIKAVNLKMSDSEDNVLNLCTKKARMSLVANADGSGDDQVT